MKEATPAPRDWGRRLIPPSLREQRRRRRRVAVTTARGLGHRLSRWVLLSNMRHALYGVDGGTVSPWEWSCICLDCGHRLYAAIHPYWVSVDGIPEERGIDGCAATPGIDRPCPAARTHQLPLFYDGERDTPRVPISVMEAIGGRPAAYMNVGTPTRQRLVVCCHTCDIDPATGLCRHCGRVESDHDRAVAAVAS